MFVLLSVLSWKPGLLQPLESSQVVLNGRSSVHSHDVPDFYQQLSSHSSCRQVPAQAVGASIAQVGQRLEGVTEIPVRSSDDLAKAFR